MKKQKINALNLPDQKIFDQRQNRYGDHLLGHTNLGLAWTGLLQNHYQIKLPHPIPAHLAELMMAANKANRAAVIKKFWRDNFDDHRIYVSMAEDAARTWFKDKKKKEKTNENS